MTILMSLLSLPPLAIASAPNKPAQTWKQDRIWITFWSAPPDTDQMLKQVALENFNLTWTSEKGLDVAARYGLRAMLHEEAVLNPQSLDDPQKKKQLDAMIDRVKGHKALEAYFLRDEPKFTEFANWARLVAYLKERDPAHVAFINLQPCYATPKQLGITLCNLVTFDRYGDYLREFVATVKPGILSYDHYYLYKKANLPDFFLNLEKVRETALNSNIPFINIIQACQWAADWKMPNAAELRLMAYSTLAYGGRGVAYFLYWGPTAYGGLYRDGKPMPVIKAVAKLNSEIAALSPELMRLKSIGVYHTGALPNGTKPLPANSRIKVESASPLVVGLFSDGSRSDFAMIVNRDSASVAQVNLNALNRKTVYEFDRALKGWKRIANGSGSARLQLEAGDGKLLKMDF